MNALETQQIALYKGDGDLTPLEETLLLITARAKQAQFYLYHEINPEDRKELEALGYTLTLVAPNGRYSVYMVSWHD